MISIITKEISPLSVKIKELFKLLDEHNTSHCSPDICHLTQPEDFAKLNSILIGIEYNNQLAGMGGLIFFSDYAEITRMFVKDEFKGNGFGKALLKELELIAQSKKLKALKLETNANFKAAVQLYYKMGFNVCEPFGNYKAQGDNLYFEKYI